ncbi:MAG: response regulator, partial [bacterium]
MVTRKPEWSFAVGLLGKDDPLFDTLRKRLETLGSTVLVYRDVGSLIDALSKNEIAVVVGDHDLGGFDVADFLKLCKRTKSDTAVIIIGSGSNMDSASESARSMAHGFMKKPFDIDHMIDFIDSAFDPARLK